MEKKANLCRKASLSSRLSHGVLTTLAVASLTLTTANARAACGISPGIHAGAPVMPMLAQAEGDWGAPHKDSIVGLWHVVYTANKELFNETLDQWHSDGTEFESAYLPPAMGNLCVGVWKPVGERTVRLHHVGWTFDPASVGTANGTFTLDETVTVSSDGKTYAGTFTFKTQPLTGPSADITGTIAAKRITVD
jgi:hypothetical protein